MSYRFIIKKTADPKYRYEGYVHGDKELWCIGKTKKEVRQILKDYIKIINQK